MATNLSEEKKLNKEQLDAIKHKNGPLLIIAGAGTGKTTVITERIKYLIFSKLAKPQEILALTFTDKAAREMEERVDIAMPYGYTQMWISTFHSFCDRVLRQEALNIGLDPRYKLMTQSESIQFIRDHFFEFDLDYFRPLGNPNKFIGGMLQHFSRLQDEDISPIDYINWLKKIKIKNKRKNLSKEEKLETKKFEELSKAYRKYDELKVQKGFLDFGDLIVKTLELFRTRKNVLVKYQKQFKYILIDEFQDTNFAQNELAKILVDKKQNITVCGDDDQCLPPTTKIDTPNGKIKIKNLKKGDSVVTAVGKGHLSLSQISHVNKTKKTTRFLTFQTDSGKKVEVTDNHKMFCMIPGKKFNSDLVYYVYLMWRKGLGWRMGITDDISVRLKLERTADKIIAVKAFESLEEVRLNETLFSLKYQIPTYPFKPRKRMILTKSSLIKLFSEFDTQKNVEKLARDFGIDLNFHHYCLGAVVRGEKERIKVILEMCCRRHSTKGAKDRLLLSPKVVHEVRIESSSKKIRKNLLKKGLNLTKAKKGWRIRKSFNDITEAGNFAKKIVNLTDGIFEVRFNVGKRNKYSRSALMMPAGNILEGMYIPVRDNYGVKYDRVTKRTEEVRREIVYDLDIERTHNFIADGVVVHNSIYRFRGAAVSNIIQFRKSFPKSKVVVLTKNYRSTQEILNKAYKLIQHNNPDRLEVVEKVNKRLVSQIEKDGEIIKFIHVDRVENEADLVAQKIEELVKDKKYDYKDFAILVRANNHSEPFGRAFLRKAIPYQFLGPGRLFKQSEVLDLVSYLRVLYDFSDSVSLYRILSMDYFDILPRDLAAIGNYARKYNLSLFEACEKIDEIIIKDESKEKIKKLISIINKHLKLVRKETAGQLLYYFLEETGLLTQLLNPNTMDVEKKASNISKFFDKLKSYEIDHEDSTVSAVVDWIELSTELGESPLVVDNDWTNINAVNILTVHSAKGLEFSVVFLVNLVSQRFPSLQRREQIPIPESIIKEILPVGDYHLEEERRLFYVGMTRAKDMLYLTGADYYGEGKREKNLSPFIYESLGDDLISSEQKIDDSKQLSFLDYSNKNKKEKTNNIKIPLDINYLSYSQINTFQTCPLHYKLRYIFKVPTPQTASQSFGTSIHSTLKDFYNLVLSGKRPTEKLIFECLENSWVKEGFKTKKHERKFYDKGKLYLAGFLKEGFDPKNLPIALEQPFTIPLKLDAKNVKSLKIGGVIDRVDVFPDGSIEIVDYKTGANIPSQREVDKNLQLSFYGIAATEIPEIPFNKKADQIKLSLYYLDEQEKITTYRTQEDLEKAKIEIFKVRDEIEKSDFVCSGNYLCRDCEYKLLCNVEG